MCINELEIIRPASLFQERVGTTGTTQENKWTAQHNKQSKAEARGVWAEAEEGRMDRTGRSQAEPMRRVRRVAGSGRENGLGFAVLRREGHRGSGIREEGWLGWSGRGFEEETPHEVEEVGRQGKQRARRRRTRKKEEATKYDYKNIQERGEWWGRGRVRECGCREESVMERGERGERWLWFQRQSRVAPKYKVRTAGNPKAAKNTRPRGQREADWLWLSVGNNFDKMLTLSGSCPS